MASTCWMRDSTSSIENEEVAEVGRRRTLRGNSSRARTLARFGLIPRTRRPFLRGGSRTMTLKMTGSSLTASKAFANRALNKRMSS